MPPAISTLTMPKRHRRPVQKSFSGCSTCKARKIKCDERKPSCTQCGAKRIACPGYPARPRLRWSRKHEVLEPTQFVSSDRTLSLGNSERREPTVFETSPPDKTHASVVDGDEISETQAVDASSSISNDHEHASTTSESIPEDALDVSPQGDSWGWVEELLNTCLDGDDTTAFSFDNQPSMSSISLPSPTCGLYLSCETNAVEEPGYDTGITEAQDEPCSSGSEENPGSAPHFQPTAPEWSGSTTSEGLEVGTNATQCQIVPSLVDLPGQLVAIYFSVVCPIFSTFDSEHNVFRSFINQRWQFSALVFYTVQSMAAAKMTWFMPEMKAQAFEYRSLALSTLHSDISKASSWNTELLFVVMMLGISSCWFDISDLGLTHLEAAQQAMLSNKIKYSDGFHNANFFKNALTYWEMVSCVVSDKAAFHDWSKVGVPQPEPLTQSKKLSPTSPQRVKPHPWTGVASEPQALFTRIARQIRRLRSFDDPTGFSDEVRILDEAIWACNLPRLHDISNIGDENTPAIHHLLLAEAYMFANLYQLYSIFANERRKRITWIKETSRLSRFDQDSWAGSQASSWASMLQHEHGAEKWLQFLGRSVIIRLEQIQTTSGTCCVQALLLLVAATSLPMSPEAKENDEEHEDVLQARRFVLDRLGFLAQSNLSAPVNHVKSVVLRIFKRLDVGVDDFWLDALQSMGTLTIIG
ncbi:hypothetical protein FDECE_4550 [Fusarium decemcellulare]|nr:hypothetical protein FDECE_4550 [Fusarium decemcellulare]